MPITLSPLRYPGGKTQLYNYTQSLIEKNNLLGCTYVEPYAGGSGLALALLNNEVVDNIILNDIDRSIYAFWNTVLTNNDKLCEKIISTDITINEWYKQKEIQNNKSTAELFELAFSTLFLNRTNHSGIITAGPIGGYNQNGNYKLNCRFNKKSILQKLNLIDSYKDKIHFYNLDAIEFFHQLDNHNNIFIFLDPPYFYKGKELYTNYYDTNNHITLAKEIAKLNHKWIVTYDNVDEIKQIYQDYISREYTIKYSANTSYKGTEVMFYSPNLNPV
jgi:DNA adenine methylase